jgi:hypothetical protein
MDVAMDYEAPDTFYREEGGKMVLWRRNGRRCMKLFNAYVSGTREEGTTLVSEGERSMCDIPPLRRDGQF